MTNESIEKSRGEYEGWFTKMEIQVTKRSHNMSIPMGYLENKFGPFGEFCGSNSEVGSDKKLKNAKDQ